MKRILLVDDEIQLLQILKSSLQKKGYTVLTASSGEEARTRIHHEQVDIVVLDMMLLDTTGLDLLQEFVPLYPNKVFIVMTAYGNIESAVAAMKAGAFDYITKPAKLEEIVLVIERAYEWLMMKAENDTLKEKLKQLSSIKPFVSASATMNRIFQLIERVADTNATVLLHGESGTGKSMFARLIHDLSGRSKAPFITVNCAAIPEQLLESELFGYEKGAFTGAVTARQGKFEAADKGTIFLDEIGEISPALQAKLLQVTQEKTFMRLGSNQLRRVDVRIISATNRNLKEMVQSGKFREDLYYRLNIVDIHVPPLRERKEDIPVLVEFFLERHREKTGKKFTISKELMELLKEYPWPGNVREVENAIERAVVLCREERISLEDFPQEIREFRRKIAHDPAALPDDGEPFSLHERIHEFEANMIQKVLQECHGNAAAAARRLGLSRQNLLYKMNKYQINAKEFSQPDEYA